MSPHGIYECPRGHLCSQDVHEDVGGCPYCLHTPGERAAALQARESLMRRLKKEGRLK